MQILNYDIFLKTKKFINNYIQYVQEHDISKHLVDPGPLLEVDPDMVL